MLARNETLQLTAVLNNEVPLGESLNALAHMTLGLGHRVQGEPAIRVVFGNSAQVREFRQQVLLLKQVAESTIAYSDFPHTMSGGDTRKQLLEGQNTPEAQLKYFGCCAVTSINETSMQKIIQSCYQLVDYKPYDGAKSETVSLLPAQIIKPNDIDNIKIIMLVNHKLPLAQTINAMILCSLAVGRMADLSALRLLNVVDKDNTIHPNISFHPYLILKPQAPEKHHMMAKEAAAAKSQLVNKTITGPSGSPLATVVFGERTRVDEVIQRKLTRLFDSKLDATSLTPIFSSAVDSTKLVERNVERDQETTSFIDTRGTLFTAVNTDATSPSAQQSAAAPTSTPTIGIPKN